MKRFLPLALFFLAAAVLLAAPTKTKGPRGTSTITSDRLDFDYKDMVALFEGNVHIVDPEFTMKADQMLIHFDNTNDISRVDAIGHVQADHADARATCGKATYTRANGAIVLTEKPFVKKGENSVRGEKITIFIGDSRVIVENGVELQGSPEQKTK